MSFSSAQTAETSTPANPQVIETIVMRELVSRNLPGASLAITRGGLVVQVSGYGQDSSGRPVTRDTPFYIASTSKAMTAVAVMQLVDAGRIELRRCEMSCGLPCDGGAAEPGRQHRYFNPNYSVAARLVEKVSGESFDAYLRNHLFAPLGMSETKTVDFIDEARDGPARGYVFAFGHPIRAPGGPFFINGAGGVVSTAADMAQWVAAHTNGGVAPNGARILSTEALRETHTSSPTSRGYAFGWNVYPDGRISHSGGLTTYSAYVAFFEGGDGIVVLTPGFDSNAPRNIALAVLAHRRGQQPAQPGSPLMPKLDVAAATLLVLNWLFTARVLVRTKVWVRRSRPVWRTVLGFTFYVSIAGAILLGLPNLVGQAIPWSWLWLAYYYPIWTLFLLSLAGTSLLIITVRTVAILRNRRTVHFGG